jgi:hypothetical protein
VQMNFFRAFALALVVATDACYASRVEPEKAEPLQMLTSSRRQGYEPGLVRSAELKAVDAWSLSEALQQTRPDFLRPKPAVFPYMELVIPSIYIDGKFTGAPEVLQLVPVAEVNEVRYLRPASARLAFGSSCRCAGGVIAVRTWAAR